jgi:hypothetical protein
MRTAEERRVEVCSRRGEERRAIYCHSLFFTIRHVDESQRDYDGDLE